tara:strand:- start:21254 stop:21385 length:132 start_codon:yes stop_codon:yes gene_type:complete
MRVKEKIKDIVTTALYYTLLGWFAMSVAGLVAGFGWAIYTYTR